MPTRKHSHGSIVICSDIFGIPINVESIGKRERIGLVTDAVLFFHNDLPKEVCSYLTITEYCKSMIGLCKYYYNFVCNNRNRNLFIRWIGRDLGLDFTTHFSDQLSTLTTPQMVTALYGKLDDFLEANTRQFRVEWNWQIGDESVMNKLRLCVGQLCGLVRLVQLSLDYSPEFVYQRFKALSKVGFESNLCIDDFEPDMIENLFNSEMCALVYSSPFGDRHTTQFHFKATVSETGKLVFYYNFELSLKQCQLLTGMVWGSWRHAYDNQLPSNDCLKRLQSITETTVQKISAPQMLFRFEYESVLKDIINYRRNGLQFYCQMWIDIFDFEWSTAQYDKCAIEIIIELFITLPMDTIHSILLSNPVKALLIQIRGNISTIDGIKNGLNLDSESRAIICDFLDNEFAQL